MSSSSRLSLSNSNSSLRYKELEDLDDDSSDDEEMEKLMNKTIFTPHKHKQKLVIGKRYNTDPAAEETADSVEMSKEEIDEEAKRQVADLDLHLVNDVASMDQLGWFYRKAKRREEYFPCRKCGWKEGIGLFPESDPALPGHVLVRVLGWKNASTGTYERIRERQWQVFGKNDERKLRAFLNLKSTKNAFPDDPVGLKLEELAIKAQWEKVREYQDRKPSPAPTDDGQENNDPMQSKPAACPTEELPMSMEYPRIVSNNNSPQDTNDEKNLTPSRARNLEMDDDGDDDFDNILSPGQKKQKERLRDGDVIEYYDPIGVAGKDEWLRRATILGIDAQDRNMPLNLDNGQSLDRHCLVKLIQRRIRDKLEPTQNSSFKPLREYSVRTCGTAELLAIQKKAQHAKKIRQSHQDSVAEFWAKNGSGDAIGEQLEPVQTDTEEPESNAVAVISQETQEEKVSTSADPAWKVHLEDMLQSTLDNMKHKKSYKPKMHPAHLELVMKVWARLQQRMDRTQETTQEALVLLSNDLRLSRERVDAIMHGDPKNLLSDSNKNEVMVALSKWLDPTPADPPLNEESAIIEKPEAAETPRRRRRSLKAAVAVPSTNRRTRQKLEPTPADTPLDNESRMSKQPETVETPRRRRRSLRSTVAVPSTTGRTRQNLEPTPADTPLDDESTMGKQSEIVETPRRRRRSLRSTVAVPSTTGKTRQKLEPTPADTPLDDESTMGKQPEILETPRRRRRSLRSTMVMPSTTRRKRQSHQEGVAECGENNSDKLEVVQTEATTKEEENKANVIISQEANGTEPKGNILEVVQTETTREEEHSEIAIISQEAREEVISTSDAPTWRKNLEGMLQSALEKMKRRKRFKPKMEPAHLELVMKVWARLQERIDRTQVPAKEAIVHLSAELGLSLERVDAMMHGDPKKKLSDPNKKEVLAVLSKWLGTTPAETPLDEDTNIGKKPETVETERWRKNSVQSPVAVPSTNGRKRKSDKEHVAEIRETNGTELEGDKHSAVQTEATAEDQNKAIANIPEQTQGERISTSDPEWKIYFDDLLHSTLEKMEKKKRYKPNMQPEHLKLVMKVWTRLQQRIDRTQETTQQAVVVLTKDLGLSWARVDAIMHGDPNKLLSDPNKDEVMAALSKWLNTTPADTPLDSDCTNSEKPETEETPRRRKRSFQTTAAVPSTNRRKRQKVEMAKQLFNDSCTSLSLSTHSRHEQKPIPATPSTQRARRTSGTHAAAGNQTNRLTRSVDTLAKARSRQSYAPTTRTEPINAREIFKQPTAAEVEPTPSKRKAATPSYEPPSVTRRRKRQSGLLSRSSTMDSEDTMPRKKQKRRTIASVSSLEREAEVSPIQKVKATIQSSIEVVKSKMKTTQRYAPHMTVEQLELALSFWNNIEIDTDDGVSEYIANFASQFEVSHFKLFRFVTGDQEKKLSSTQIGDIAMGLKAIAAAESSMAKTVTES